VPHYLTVEDVARINEAEAGRGNLADFGLLEAAVLRPQTTVGGEDAYPDMHTKAGAILHSLARNHPFVDGNKRTAALAMILFYRLNGWGFHAEQDTLVALVTDVAEGFLDVSQIAGLLKGYAFDEIDCLPDA
jgi:death-on-curing protein